MAKKPKKSVEPVVESVQAPTPPRYNAEGVLLNPQDCHVTPEGLVKAKG